MDILRGKRLLDYSEEVGNYTSSIKDDHFLILPTIKINKAHMLMLVQKGLVKSKDGYLCLKALDAIPSNLQMDPKLEDVHMNIESQVIKEVGELIGGQLNLAKSRNDQVATAIRMTLREFILDISTSLIEFQKVILRVIKDHIYTVMPGYTHMQHAQPITLAHHFLAHHDSLSRDGKRLIELYERVNLCPMGAGALATTSFDIDRVMVSKLLGFSGLIENSIDAVSSRDFAIETLSDLAILMTNLSRLSEEIIIWNSQEFSIVEIPDEFASTSSIMPQKKNPVVVEIVRAKTCNIYGHLIATLSMLQALPYSYNLDLQELTHHIWNACMITLSTIKILSSMIEKIQFNTKRLSELTENGMLSATDLADTIVREHSIPFRLAHRIVGELVRKALKENKTLEKITKENLNELLKETTGKTIITSYETLQKVFNINENILIKSIIGGPNPKEVSRMLKDRLDATIENDFVDKKRHLLNDADKKLEDEILKLKEVINL